MPCAEIAVAGIHDRFGCVDVFDLDGSVIDFEFFVHESFDFCEYGAVIKAVPSHHNMTAHGKYARRERPDVKVVNRADARNFIQLLLKINNIDVRGSAFQQYVDSIPN